MSAKAHRTRFVFVIVYVIFQYAMSAQTIFGDTKDAENQEYNESRKKTIKDPTYDNLYKYHYIWREWLLKSGNALEWSEDRVIFDLLCQAYIDRVRSEKYDSAEDWLNMLCDMYHYKYIEDNAPGISEYLVDDFLKTASKQAILLLGKLKNTNVKLLKELLAKKGPYNLAYMNAALARCGDKEAEYWLLQYVHKEIRYPPTWSSPGDKQLHLAYACVNTEHMKRFLAENLRTRECFVMAPNGLAGPYCYYSLGLLYRRALIYMLRDEKIFPCPKYVWDRTTVEDMRDIERYCEKCYGIVYTQTPLGDPEEPLRIID